MNGIDFGIFYLKDNFSIKGSFPTKIAEFLSMGIPIITNPFNEDIEHILDNNKLGLKTDFKEKSIISDNKKINLIIHNYIQYRQSCIEYCRDNLSLDMANKKYLKIYKEIFN